MLTAYLDESGQEKRGVVRVGGFIGNEDQWKKLAAEWPKGFEGSQRKSLHMANFKFKHETEKILLAKLGPIPYECGLRRIMASVDVRDYYDLIEGTTAEANGHGYAMALLPLIEAIQAVVPTRESYKLVFETQEALGFYRDKMLDLIAYTLSHPPRDKRHIKRPQLVAWETIAKGQSCLCEPADYLCYHLSHKAEDANSVRALWTVPIMHGVSIWKSHLSREKARWYFQEIPLFDRLHPDDLEIWKKAIRSGQIDPWSKVLKQAENRYIQKGNRQ